MKKILIIEDDPSVRQMAVRALRKAGYDVAEAADGRGGLETARRDLPDLVLSDIMMNEVDGFSVLQNLRSQWNTSAIPIILMTGVSDTKNLRLAMELGADDFLPKPFTLKALEDAVRVRLERHGTIQKQTHNNEKRLLEILKATNDLVAIVDQKTRCLSYLNRAGRRMLGITDEADITSLRLDDFEVKNNSGTSGNRQTEESVIQSKDGLQIRMEKQVLEHFSSDADNSFVSIVASDITERERANTALLESEKRYRDLIHCQGEGVVISGVDFTLTFANPAAESIFGVGPGELAGKNIGQFLSEKDQQTVQAQLELREAGQRSTYEIEIIVAGGRERRSVLVTGTPQFDPQGNFTGTLAIFRDITERKRAEAALRDSEQKYRGLFESSRDAILTVEPSTGRFISGNPATLKLFGASSEAELVSFGPGDLSPEFQPDGTPSAVKAKELSEIALRDGSHSFDWTHRRIDGKEFFAQVSLTRMLRGEKPIILSTVRDITARKRT